MRWVAAVLTGLAFAAAAGLPARAEPTQRKLEPYQMVYSLQLVQDRIADGDQAALPMQRKLLELIDARLAESTPEDFSDDRNFRSLMIYAMSGGNPTTVQKVVSQLILGEQRARLSAGLLEYVRGETSRAVAALKDIDPREVEPDIGPSLALVKGTLYVNMDPEKSLAFFDFARLAGPGTLIEEAALRRSVSLTSETGDSDRFESVSEQYVRRFLRSPYASQFADYFVLGVARLHATLKLDRIAEIIDDMNDEQSTVVYLRIARQAAIDRLDELLIFAREGLERSALRKEGGQEARAVLYSGLAAVASEDVAGVRDQLETIDPSQLSEPDRALLEAARKIADEVVSPPSTAGLPKRRPEIDDVVSPAPKRVGGDHGRPFKTTEDYVADKRNRLEAIDQLLQETTQ